MYEIKNKIPPNLESRFLGKQKRIRAIREAKAIKVSILNASENGTGIIKLESPTTKRMLNKLLPIIFPIAMSQFFLKAAITEVKSSGKDVPKATIVKPMNLSLQPKKRAMKVADFTTKLLPKITRPNPIIVKNIAFIIDIFGSFELSESLFVLCS